MGRRTFSREFKLEAVKLVKDRGVSVTQAAKDLGLSQSVLGRWVREASEDPKQAFPGRGQMKPDDAEVARLKRELAKTKAERDILKKCMVCPQGSKTSRRSPPQSFRVNVSGLFVERSLLALMEPARTDPHKPYGHEAPHF
jgi:transposase